MLEYDAQSAIYRGPDADYQDREICFGANETALSIAAVTDRENPVAIACGEYRNVGYAHQGWLTEGQRYFFGCDEAGESPGSVDGTRTLIWDVADLDDPIPRILVEVPASEAFRSHIHAYSKRGPLPFRRRSNRPYAELREGS